MDAENVIALIPSVWRTNDACCSHRKEEAPLLLVMDSDVRCCKLVKQAEGTSNLKLTSVLDMVVHSLLRCAEIDLPVLFGSARCMFVGLKSDVVDSARNPCLL